MPFLLIIVVLLAIVFLPQWWVKSVMRRHARPREDFPGTGGEFAQHLATELKLEITVEETEDGDHYDPSSKTVRLSEDNFHGKSLTAVTIAAHEIGHAIQDASDYRPLIARGRLVKLAATGQKLGAGLLVITPFVAILTHIPAAGVLTLLAGFATLGLAAVAHLITLPEEWDASFKRALPLLEAGRYLPPQDYPAARQLLTAAALTYVAAAMTSLLNFWAWIRLLRR